MGILSISIVSCFLLFFVDALRWFPKTSGHCSPFWACLRDHRSDVRGVKVQEKSFYASSGPTWVCQLAHSCRRCSERASLPIIVTNCSNGTSLLERPLRASRLRG